MHLLKPPVLLSLACLLAGSSSALFSGNIYSGARQFSPSTYASKVDNSISMLRAAGDATNATLFTILRSIPTAIWLSSVSNVNDVLPSLPEVASKIAKAGSVPVVVTFIIYDLPGRDCSAGQSAGEFAGPDNLSDYKSKYIDLIVSKLKPYENVTNLRFSFLVEPDSLPNLATNLGITFCAQMADTYKAGIVYAIQKLSTIANAAIYMDAAWCGWLGYDANRQAIVKVFSDVLTTAGGTLAAGSSLIRGFATDISNYSPFINKNDTYAPQYLPNPDEQSYIHALSTDLESANITGKKFLVDSSRNGRGSIRDYGTWCNVRKAGLGTRPTANTGDSLVDAFVWAKTPGESDGNSNYGGCNGAENFIPSPDAGQWNHAHLLSMVAYANPAITSADNLTGTDPDYLTTGVLPSPVSDGSGDSSGTTPSPTPSSGSSGNSSSNTERMIPNTAAWMVMTAILAIFAY